MPAKDGQYRYFLLTLPHHEFTPYLPSGVQYIKGQLEIGNNTNYLHWQLVAYFKSKKTYNQVKAIFGETCHVEKSNSDKVEAYVWKEVTVTHWDAGISQVIGNESSKYSIRTRPKIIQTQFRHRLGERPCPGKTRRFPTYSC